ncbi:uncharacterized protein BJ212DRAFT_1475821 [Suillus subaureus]|uniref:Uncharacterized protein n=1 Tax=Suillus subaureus TaxID=48587 RepID=A0A9P7JID9_9AGAM|nr:uncharacterized protein BJ212DRAFT_1475821 [Suillus subaureus]KAG1824516.1 hypothetical protein BJ212DRAFT_1475821 [Suillus subaureus]
MATSSFFSKVLDVLNISSRFSLRYFKLQLIAWQQYVQGSIFTLPAAKMSCALGSDGKLKDASAIDWYNDPDDDTPMVPAPPPSTSNGKLTSFMSCHSGRAVKLMEKIHEAVNTAPVKRSAPAPPQDQPAPKRVQTGSHLIRHHDDDNDDEPPVTTTYAPIHFLFLTVYYVTSCMMLPLDLPLTHTLYYITIAVAIAR